MLCSGFGNVACMDWISGSPAARHFSNQTVVVSRCIFLKLPINSEPVLRGIFGQTIPLNDPKKIRTWCLRAPLEEVDPPKFSASSNSPNSRVQNCSKWGQFILPPLNVYHKSQRRGLRAPLVETNPLVCLPFGLVLWARVYSG